jgi:hypothetical protein
MGFANAANCHANNRALGLAIPHGRATARTCYQPSSSRSSALCPLRIRWLAEHWRLIGRYFVLHGAVPRICAHFLRGRPSFAAATELKRHKQALRGA